MKTKIEYSKEELQEIEAKHGPEGRKATEEFIALVNDLDPKYYWELLGLLFEEMRRRKREEKEAAASD